ncbi:MAG: hypothetical protein IJH18_02000 [Bacilli bacterium]|nr:hypothetical protein [Bacilli bacterium]
MNYDYHKEEFNYVYNKYIKVLKSYSDFMEIENRPCEVKPAQLNGKAYKLYQYNYDEVLLVPNKNDLFAGDFDNIIRFSSYEKAGFKFTIISKEDGTIKKETYEYGTYYSDGYPRGKYAYTEMNDEDNLLYQKFLRSKQTTEEFIQKNEVEELGESSRIYAFTRLEHGDKKTYVSPVKKGLLGVKIFGLREERPYSYVNSDKSLVETSEIAVNKSLEKGKVKVKKND